MVRVCCIICLLLSDHIVNAQQGFFSIYYDQLAMTYFTRATATPDGGYFAIDNNSLVRVDAAGEVRAERKLFTDPLTILQAIAVYDTECQVAAYDYTTSRLLFFSVDEAGEPGETVESERLVPPGEQFFVGKDSVLVAGKMTDPQGNETGFAELFDTNDGRVLFTYNASVTGTAFRGAKRIGNHILLFGAQSGSPFSKGVISRIDLEGNEEWIGIYPGNTNASINDVEPGAAGSLHAILWLDKSSEILRIGSSGELLHQVQLPLAVARYLHYDRTSGELFIVGNSRDRMFFSRMNKDDRISWWRFYGSGVVTEFGEQIRGLIAGDDSFSFWGSTRWDAKSRPFMVRTDRNGLVDASVPASLVPVLKRINSRSEYSRSDGKLLSATFLNDGRVIAGGELLSIPSSGSDNTSGFAVALDFHGDTLWTKPMVQRLPSGHYVKNAIVNVKPGFNDTAIIQEHGGRSGLYSVNGPVFPDPVEVTAGKRSDFVAVDESHLLMCYHSFDIQPYNEVGQLLSIDLSSKVILPLGERMIGSMIHKIIPSKKGTFYVAGESIKTYEMARKGLFMEVTRDGRILQRHLYDLDYKTFVNAIAIGHQGQIVLAGSVEDEQGRKDLMIAEVNSDGQLLRSRKYDLHGKDDIHSIETTEGGYLISGEVGKPVFGLQQSFGMVAKIDDELNIVAAAYLGTPGRYSQVINAHPVDDGNVVIVGNSEQWIDGTFYFGPRGFLMTVSLDAAVLASGNEHDGRPSFYPNPFSNSLQIERNGWSLVNVWDIRGQRINVQIRGDHVDGSFLQPGVYFARFRKGSRLVTLKLVKTSEEKF